VGSDPLGADDESSTKFSLSKDDDGKVNISITFLNVIAYAKANKNGCYNLAC
jgi:hypothetical protein